jgi:hypothetical protein
MQTKGADRRQEAKKTGEEWEAKDQENPNSSWMSLKL